MAVRERWMESPIGTLHLVAEEGALVGLAMEERPKRTATAASPGAEDPVLAEAERQLTAWFKGERTGFDLKLAPKGTPFQLAVWRALREIPFGETCSYRDLAARVGRPKAVRAVGAANGRNPIAIVVPCHRVIGADGTLTGYGGGLPRKRWLLAHEHEVGQRGEAGVSRVDQGSLRLAPGRSGV